MFDMQESVKRTNAALDRFNGNTTGKRLYCVGSTFCTKRTAIGIRAGKSVSYFSAPMTRKKAKKALRGMGLKVTGNHLDFSTAQ